MAQQLLRSAAAAGRRRALESLLAQATRGADSAAVFGSSRSIASPALIASTSSSSSFDSRRFSSSSFSSQSSAAAAAAGTSGGDGEDDKDKASASAARGEEAPSTSASATPGGTTEWRSWIESRLSELDDGEEGAAAKEGRKTAAVAAAVDVEADDAAATESREGKEEAKTAAAAETAATEAPSPPPPTTTTTAVRRALPPPRLAVIEPHAADLPSPFTGYAELGEPSGTSAASRGGEGGRQGAGGATAADATPLASPSPLLGGGRGGDAPFRRPPPPQASFAPGRLHPTRIFYPGQTYEPGELAPAASTSSSAGGSSMPFPPNFAQRRDPLPPKSALFVVAASDQHQRRLPRTLVDFRDARTLQGLLSETGKLPPRRRTRLSQKHHRHLMRQVKLARQLALLHPLNNRDRADGGGFGDDDGEIAAAGEEGGEGASERASS